jgi:hypothetical protein
MAVDRLFTSRCLRWKQERIVARGDRGSSLLLVQVLEAWLALEWSRSTLDILMEVGVRLWRSLGNRPPLLDSAAPPVGVLELAIGKSSEDKF